MLCSEGINYIQGSNEMGNKPTHHVFFVQEVIRPEEGSETKPFWRQIGAAWAHKSGKGFSMKLDLLPADPSQGELVMLEAAEKPEKGQEAADTAQPIQ